MPSTASPGYSSTSSPATRRVISSEMSTGTNRSSVPAVAHRVEENAALGGGAGAELDQRPRPRRGDDLGRSRVEDLALAAGRVVLGLFGDPLEQLRAALVVEVLRRQLLERAREALAHDLGHAGERAAVGQVDLDLDRSRRPSDDPPRSGSRRRSAGARGGPSCGRWCGSRSAASPMIRPAGPGSRGRRRPPSTRGTGRARIPGSRPARSWSIPRRRRASPRRYSSTPSRPRRAGSRRRRDRGSRSRDRSPRRRASHSSSVGRRLPAQAANAPACR